MPLLLVRIVTAQCPLPPVMESALFTSASYIDPVTLYTSAHTIHANCLCIGCYFSMLHIKICAPYYRQ